MSEGNERPTGVYALPVQHSKKDQLMPDIDKAAPDSPAADAPESGGTHGTPSQAPSSVQFDPSRHIEKSEFTRARQKDAEQRKQLEAAIREREEALSTREQKLLQAAQLLQQRMQGGQSDEFAELRDMPYVDGRTLVQLMEQFRGNELGGIVNAMRQRDQALTLMHNQMLQMQKTLSEMRGKHVETEFDGNLSKVRGELGLPDEPWAAEFLKDIYLSHEGEDLQNEFPNLAKTRLTELRKALRSLDKAEAEKAKRVAIPGKGGSAVPSAKLNEGYKTPAQLADELWPLVQDRDDN